MAPRVFLGMSTTQQRLTLAALGYHVFQLQAGRKNPLPGSSGFKDATTDPEVILRWPEHTNTGVATGASGLVVLDCDNHTDDAPPEPWNVPGVATGEDALALLWAAEAEAGRADPGSSPWAECPAVLTPSGGTHLYYRAGLGTVRNSASKLAWQVDVRANGGYVVAPGAVLDGSGDGDTPGVYMPLHWPLAAPVAPEWLEKLLAPPAPRKMPQRATGAPERSIFAPGGQVTGTPSERERLGLLKTVADAQPGGRNDVLNWAAWRMAEKGLLDADGKTMLLDAARACGLDDVEVHRTIGSVLDKMEGHHR